MSEESILPSWASKDVSGNITIRLKIGVKISGAMVKAVTMRPPKVVDMKIAKRAGSEIQEIETTLFANLAGLAPQEVEDLAYVDYKRMQTAFESFLEDES